MSDRRALRAPSALVLGRLLVLMAALSLVWRRVGLMWVPISVVIAAVIAVAVVVLLQVLDPVRHRHEDARWVMALPAGYRQEATVVSGRLRADCQGFDWRSTTNDDADRDRQILPIGDIKSIGVVGSWWSPGCDVTIVAEQAEQKEMVFKVGVRRNVVLKNLRRLEGCCGALDFFDHT